MYKAAGPSGSSLSRFRTQLTTSCERLDAPSSVRRIAILRLRKTDSLRESVFSAQDDT